LVRYSFKLRGWKHPAHAKWSLPVMLLGWLVGWLVVQATSINVGDW